VIEGCGDLPRTVVSAAGAVAVSFAPRLGSDWRKVDAAEWSSGRRARECILPILAASESGDSDGKGKRRLCG
jgi:hypothetical protein